MSTTTVPGVSPAPMPADELARYLTERLEDRVIDHTVAHGQLTTTVQPDAVPTAVQLCRDDPPLDFDFFDFISGVDEREDGFAVVTHLYSTRHRHHILIRAIAEGGREEPRLPTITHLYRGANWHEREAYDMFGIVFEGHPNLLPRLLTVENFEGWPLRKDFLLMTREAKPWPGLKEPKEVEAEETSEAEATSQAPSAEDKATAAKARAERAKAKAAAMRRERAAERAAEQRAEAGDVTDEAAAAVDEEAVQRVAASNVRDASAQLNRLSTAELERLREVEQAGRNRRTLLQAIDAARGRSQ